MPAPRRAAFGFVLGIIFLDALSFGLIFPVLPRLILEVSGGDTAQAARDYGIIAGVWALANFFGAPILGALSDRYGRRPVLITSAFGFAVDLVVMALAPNVAWLIVGRFICGVTAGNFAAASAYVADITEPEKRAQRFGIFSAMYSTGMILGPAAGGLLGEISPRAPFWAAAALAFAMWLYGLLVLPESLPPEKRGPMRGLNPFASFGVLLTPGLPRLATIGTLVALAGISVNMLFVLYLDYRFGWSSAETGLLLTVFSAGNIVVMGVIGPQMVRRLGEVAALVFGLFLLAFGFAGLALAPTPLLFCLGCVVTCLGNLCGPALRALQANAVSEQEQGRLQGALGGLGALAGLTGPFVFTQMFAWSISRPGADLSGASMFAGSALMAAAAIISLGLSRPGVRA